MVSALKSSAQALKAYILQTKSRTINFVKQSGTPGHRFAPEQAGTTIARLAAGLITARHLSGMGKKEAQKDSHKVWATVDVELEDNPTYEDLKAKVEDAFQSIDDQL
ncbi:hypothetical protein EJ08DRAFT_737387 [Tothia fuscella]|uniref:Uncharacterized protein n=1 Tax=Tothia fuscella TaxID=1048955 RepID=A0A9P4TUW0_9PEZI|nr:hypothetical protein EJ08DRAFT_737387 [Tothia fuscella]